VHKSYCANRTGENPQNKTENMVAVLALRRRAWPALEMVFELPDRDLAKVGRRVDPGRPIEEINLLGTAHE
jgi:hypothetical protein